MGQQAVESMDQAYFAADACTAEGEKPAHDLLRERMSNVGSS